MKFSEFKALENQTSFEYALRQVGKSTINKEESSEDLIVPMLKFFAILALIPLAAKLILPIVAVDAVHAYIVK